MKNNSLPTEGFEPGATKPKHIRDQPTEQKHN